MFENRVEANRGKKKKKQQEVSLSEILTTNHAVIANYRYC